MFCPFFFQPLCWLAFKLQIMIIPFVFPTSSCVVMPRTWWCQLTWIHSWFGDVNWPGFTQGLVMSAHLDSPRVWWCQFTWIHPGFGDVSTPGFTQGLVMLVHLDSPRAWWCQLTWIHPRVWWCQLTWIHPGLGDVSVPFHSSCICYAVFCFVCLRPMYCQPNVVSVTGLFILD